MMPNTTNVSVSRLGILGGSFNPPHVGHLRLAIEAREMLALDRVDLLPAAVQPLKRGGDMLPFADRARLLTLALSGVPGLGLDLIEGERSGPSFTCDTLELLGQRHPGAAIFSILGAENLQKISIWKRGLELPRLATLAVLGRENQGFEQVGGAVGRFWPGAKPCEDAPAPGWDLPDGGRVLYLAVRRLDVSSTDVRARWRKGESLKFLVPDAVEAELAKGWPGLTEAWGG
jgi:nicotinate-nucleotide adenylyltransferase